MLTVPSVPREGGRSAFEHASWAASLWRMAGWPLRVAKARDLLGALGGMSDRELADIGLSRGDVRDATAVPLDGEPSDLLSARAAERRRPRTGAEVLPQRCGD